MKPKLPYFLFSRLFILVIMLGLLNNANSQTHQRVAPGEYATYNIDASGRLWASGGNPALWGTGGMEGRQALPNLVQQQSGAPMPLFKAAYAGLDDAVAIDVSGNVWHIGGADLSAAGDGSTEPGTDIAHKYATRIFTDGSGQPFTGVTMASQYWQSYTCKGWFAVKGTDSTLWIWGGDDLGAYNGTGVAQNYVPRPVQVSIPGNRKVVQIVSGTFAIARCSDGTVWTWGGGNGCDNYYAALGNGCSGTSYKFPKQVIGISNAKWVDGGRDRAFAICGGDSVFAWGRRLYIGIGSNDNQPEITPLYVTPIWNFSHGVTKIVSNVNASHLILSDSTLWAFGNTPQGEVGNGIELDRNQAPFPDWWSWDYATPLFVTTPVQLNPARHDFINSYGAMPYTYWFFDECVNGQLYFNGRNKGAIANDGIINSDTSSGGMASYFDNAWDVVTSIPVNPFSLRSPILIPAQPCVVNNTLTGCSGYTPPPVLPPAINAGADQTGVGTATVLTATSTPAPGRKIAAYVWSQISGPATAYFSTFNDSTVTVSRLVPGTYVFRITATDHLNSKAYDDIAVTSAGSSGNTGGILVGQGEYTTFFIDNSGTLTAIGNRGYSGVGGNTGAAGASGLPEPVVVSPSNLKFKYAAGHFHGGAAVDVNGRVWTMGATAGGESGMGNTDYSQYPQKILVDIDGNQFDSVIAVVPYSQSSDEGSDRHGWLAVKESGTLWIWGTPGAMRGNGTEDVDARILRPARIVIPGGRSVKQVTGGDYVIALCTDGTVWAWGNVYRANLGYIPVGTEYASPHQLTGLSGITQIAGGKEFNYALKSNGDLYGWGLLGNYMNDLTWPDGTGAEITFPQLLPNIQTYLPAPITKIVTNFSITAALLTDGSLWTWGDNTQGCIGNGESYYGNETNGYTWDYNIHLLHKIPYNVAPTRTFKNVFAGNLLTFNTYALGTDDQLYAWGTNKGSTIANRIDMPISGNVGAYDNAWNRSWPQPVDPFNIASTFISTSPVCLTDPGYPCNTYPIPANTKPTANAGPNQSVSGTSANLDGRGSTDNVFISYYIWSQVSGPNTAVMDLPGSPTPRVSGLVTGTYVFKLKTIDNGWFSDSITVEVAVNAAGNQSPTANAGTNQTITLPASGVILSGSGTDPDGTIASYAWTQISGTAATIASPSTAATNITGLTTAGTRVFRLTVTDNQGATGTADVTITVNAAAPPGNQSPTANAGVNQTIILPQSNVTVYGSGSDPDGTVASYAWTQVSGTAATIASPSTPSTNITGFIVAGVRVFRLTVTDNQGATGTSDVTITVNASGPPTNQPPVANAGANQTITLPTSGATLSGNGTDPDGTIASYAWTQVSGTAATIASPSTSSTNITGLTTEGVRVFRLTVTDNQGATGTSDVTITVNAAAPPPNQPPVANAGANQTITLPTSGVTLSGSGTDPDGTVASYAWTQVSGTTAIIASPSTSSTNITGLTTAGIRVFRLTVTDNQGATGAADVIITVNAALNQPPTADAGANQTITLPTSNVNLSGSGTDPDGTIASYAWTQVSGTAATIASPSTASTNVSGLTTTGVRVFRLTVTDNQGATGTSDVTIIVNSAANQSPTADAGPNQTITLPTSGVTLSGSGTDPDGTIISYAWTQVSGTTATITSPSTAGTNITGLTTVGIRVFRLTVTDDLGAMAASDITITVNAAPNQPPTANAGINQSITLPTSNVTLSGSGTDSDGTIASYVWTQVSGAAAIIASPSTSSTNITGLTTVGVSVFRLTVTDNQGATGTSDVAITVNAAPPPPNQSPTANAGINQTITLPTSSVTLSGSGTDPDGTIVSYAWVQVSGTAAIIASPSTASTNITGLTTVGVTVFRLTVTDNQGATGTSYVAITVNAVPNQAPTSNAGANQTITLPASTVTLSGSGTDPDGTIVSYTWIQVYGTAATIASPSMASTTITGLTTAGIRIFRLTVTDNQGGSGTSEVMITVNTATAPPNQPPVANAGLNYNITLPTNSVTLTGSGTDPDGLIASYQWSKIAGPSQFIIASPAQGQTMVNNLVEGVYQFELNVTDNQGASGKDTVVVTVNAAIQHPPAANAGPDQAITLPTYSVTVAGSGTSDPARQIAAYLWSKIAGPAQYTIVSPAQAQTVIKDLVKGIYLFELKVTDNRGSIGRDTVRIEVKEESVSTARLFPNPATTLINVEINAVTKTNVTNISVFDSRGVIVYHEQFMRSQQVMIKQIDIEKFPRGVYFATVDVDINDKRTLPFVKQ